VSTARGRAAALVGVVLVALACAAPAAARDASAQEVRALAAQAAGGDVGALAQLRDVDRVAGRPVDLAAALDAPRDQTLRARLEALAAGADRGDAPDAGAARAQAGAELDGREYDEGGAPRPLRSPLETLADLLESAWGWLPALLPGGDLTTRALLAALVLLAAGAVASRSVRRAARAERTAHGERRTSREGDPRALLRAAEEAEARGDLESALRLRFRAGVAELAARDLVPARASTSMAELERRLRSPTFTGLARRFEEVAYGGRAAQGADVAAAREGWPRVRDEAGERMAAGSAR
jgi:hypothetical protein